MSGIGTRRLTVDGIDTTVHIGGSGQQGEAVLFVHGNPDAGSDWMPLMTRVAPFATVVAPDLPGFGRADKGADLDYTVGGYARFLDGVVTALGIERVHLVAHDFGGPFATTWAADHPDRVASVTLINTGVLIGYRWHRMARLWRTPVVGELTMRLTTLAVARRVLAHDNPGLGQAWIDIVAGHLARRETKRAVLRLYRSTRTKDLEELTPRLRSQDHDALVVFGDADVYIRVEQAYRQSQPFPRAQIHTLPGVGHWSWLEQTDQVAEHVVPFLRQRVGATPKITTTQGD